MTDKPPGKTEDTAHLQNFLLFLSALMGKRNEISWLPAIHHVLAQCVSIPSLKVCHPHWSCVVPNQQEGKGHIYLGKEGSRRGGLGKGGVGES